MTLMEIAQLLGNFGEFFGAIAVVATLGYLAVQIRQNTRSMDESRRLVVAQGYQTRSVIGAQAMRQKADSRYIAEILVKSKAADFTPDSLDPVQQERLLAWLSAYIAELDNLHFQYELGFVSQEYYDNEFRRQVVQYAQSWEAMGIMDRLRIGFRQEIQRILAENNTHP